MKYIFMILLSLPFHQLFAVINTAPGPFEDKIKVKEYIEKEIPNFNQATTYKKAQLLRNFVYQRVKLGGTGDFKVEYQSLLNIFNGSNPLYCGGISATYASLLQVYDIPVRLVQLRAATCTDSKSCNASHLATEVFINNNWIIEDATFNIEWTYNNKVIGFDKLEKLFQAHLNPQDTNNNFPIIKGRTIQEYYIPYKDLLEKINFKYYTLWKNELI